MTETAPGFALDAKLLFLSPELTKEHLRVRTLHSFPTDADFVVSVSIAVKGDGVSEITSLFEGMKEFAEFMLPDPSILSLVFEGHNLCIGLNLTPFLRISHLIEAHKTIIHKIQ